MSSEIREYSASWSPIEVEKVSYTHLTQDERCQISILRKVGNTIRAIADLPGRNKSTIGRELKRNGVAGDHQAAAAQTLAVERRVACANGPLVSADTWSFVDEKLGQYWSPEQISGYLKVNDQPTVSHESIYQRIYADQRAGGSLHRVLRCRKQRRKRYRSTERRGTIPNQTSIEQRPEIVDTRERLGDWEADLVIGAAHQGALLTVNERRSRLTLIAPLASKEANVVADAMISLLKPFAAHVHTITTDNGKEFTQHERIAKALNAEFYFAHPYSSWERGANENMNGLIRQFFPKKMSLKFISDQSIKKVKELLNHRPRKCLGFKTPFNVFNNELPSPNSSVALRA
ncbi:transposase [Gammaproteobacteria bacterium]